MKIHEYQGKAILKAFGVPVPDGDVADTPAQARAIAQGLGGRVVVKAQVHAGGRGKAGGVKLADDPAGAEAAARQILGMMLKTPQTPPEGIRVLKVLVEKASPIATVSPENSVARPAVAIVVSSALRGSSPALSCSR